jgi:signal transduction histidine kinase
MTPAEARLLADLAQRLDVAADSCTFPKSDLQGEGENIGLEVARIWQSAERLLDQLHGFRELAIALGEGRIEFQAQSHNRLLDPLKALQASLRHLTWQTQEIAAGHLEHRVDFLGEFSVAFNKMIESLCEKRRTDRAAMEASRMASLGRLAGGLAHEVNTPLQFIQTNVRFLGDSVRSLGEVAVAGQKFADQAAQVPSLADAAGSLAALAAKADTDFLLEELPGAEGGALDGLGRIATVVRAVMDYTRPGTDACVPTDLPKLLDEVLTIAASNLRDVAEIGRLHDPHLPPVPCRPSELQHVFLRILSNAAQAIREAGRTLPGRITIATSLEGGTAVVRIADSGAGVPAELRDRIFDPFFTTRELGKGMGLGLTVCREIVVGRHGGTLEAGDGPEGGAQFTVRLPMIPAA